MKKIRKLFIYVLILSMLIGTTKAGYVYADEPVSEEGDYVPSDAEGDTQENQGPVATQEPEEVQELQITQEPEQTQAPETTPEEGNEQETANGQNSENGQETVEDQASEKGQEAQSSTVSDEAQDPDNLKQASSEQQTATEQTINGTEEPEKSGTDQNSPGEQETQATQKTEDKKEAENPQKEKTLTQKAGEMDEADPDMITEIEPYSIDHLKMEFKPALDEVLSKMPETIVIVRGEESEEIAVKWKSSEDYDEKFDKYPFVPVLDDYILSPELVIPSITVTFSNDDHVFVPGVIKADLGYEVPIPESSKLRKGAPPSSYNNEENGKLPAIRNQGNYGTCWSFATIGAIETDLIHDGSTNDLAELHLAYYAYHDYTDPCGCRTDSVASNRWLRIGGNPAPATRILSNMVGAVKEDDARYSDAESFNPDGSYVVSKDYAQIRNAYFINIDDTVGIKNAIMEHGGVATSYYDDDSYYSSTYNSYYCNRNDINHAVMLVGWDDNFSKSKFRSVPSGDGAWLVRNSWGGSGYNHNGYFWISYYDKSLNSSYNTEAVAIDASLDVFNNCYAYDGQYWDNEYISSGSSTATVTTTFRVKAGETLSGVGFETANANLTANVTVKNLSNNQTAKATVTTTNAGIYTAAIAGLDFTTDTDVEVSVELKSGKNEMVSIVTEYEEDYTDSGSGIRYKGVCDKGCKINGTSYSNDPRVKLYTNNLSTSGISSVGLNKSSLVLTKGQGEQLTATVSPSTVSTSLTWISSNTSVATVSSNGYVKAVSDGNATITVKTSVGGRTASCYVKVEDSSTPSPAPTPNTSVSYRTHVQNVGWQGYVSNGAVSGTTGRSLRLEGINISLPNKPYSGGIRYRTHVQNIGWQGWVQDGAMSGTSGRSLRLEAIIIELYGAMAQYYDVYYRVHAQNFGWMGWAKNGAASGTAGYSYRLEAIQIQIVPKGTSMNSNIGGISSSTSTIYADANNVGASDATVTYRTHVQNVGWQGWKSNGDIAGTSGRSLRLEGINIEADSDNYYGGIWYQTHVQNIGWQDWCSDGEMSGTSGRSLRLEAIRIELYGDMEQKYDVYYRVHAQNFGWMGWAKNGASAGTAGYSYRLEAIQIVLVNKGSGAPGATYKGVTRNTTAAYRSR